MKENVLFLSGDKAPVESALNKVPWIHLYFGFIYHYTLFGMISLINTILGKILLYALCSEGHSLICDIDPNRNWPLSPLFSFSFSPSRKNCYPITFALCAKSQRQRGLKPAHQSQPAGSISRGEPAWTRRGAERALGSGADSGARVSIGALASAAADMSGLVSRLALVPRHAAARAAGLPSRIPVFIRTVATTTRGTGYLLLNPVW